MNYESVVNSGILRIETRKIRKILCFAMDFRIRIVKITMNGSGQHYISFQRKYKRNVTQLYYIFIHIGKMHM